jgi:hypothetical protein
VISTPVPRKPWRRNTQQAISRFCQKSRGPATRTRQYARSFLIYLEFVMRGTGNFRPGQAVANDGRERIHKYLRKGIFRLISAYQRRVNNRLRRYAMKVSTTLPCHLTHRIWVAP